MIDLIIDLSSAGSSLNSARSSIEIVFLGRVSIIKNATRQTIAKARTANAAVISTQNKHFPFGNSSAAGASVTNPDVVYTFRRLRSIE
jgi:hypothetical protein